MDILLVRAVRVHKLQLAALEARPEPDDLYEKAWLRGSIQYHRDAIRHLEAREKQEEAQEEAPKTYGLIIGSL